MRSTDQLFADGKILPLVEEFYTVQGEGYHTGKAAYFIRLGGCDIGCSWCDTKFSWNPSLHPTVETDSLVAHALEQGTGAVVITGGEPLSYNLDYLCGRLKEEGLTTFLETSGAFPLTGQWDWICLSPKRNTPPLPAIFLLANELKVVIQTRADLSWAEQNAEKVRPACMLYLQPEWSQYEAIVPVLVEYIKKNTEWRISLQAHKFMHIP